MKTTQNSKAKAAKKAAKTLNSNAKKATSKVYGKAVMKETSPGRKIGYASVSKTKLPDYKPRKIKATKAAKRTTKGKMY